MITIEKANVTHAPLLTAIGSQSFIESHGSSALPEHINEYVKDRYTDEVFAGDLGDQRNISHIIYYNGLPAGYSKIILNIAGPNIEEQNITKMERLYLLREFYDLKLGLTLLNFNIELSKTNGQTGMWLFVWKGNPRAVNFYKENGFEVIGHYDFKLTDTHSNPNYQMLLRY